MEAQRNVPDFVARAAERNAHPYHMWDGICGIEQTLASIRDSYEGDTGGISAIAGELAARERLYFAGCGTSYYNSMAAQFIFNRVAGINASAVYALEFTEFPPPDMEKCGVVGISHTGGTASVIEALSAARAGGAYTAAVSDVEHSAICSAVHACLPGYGGREASLPKTRSYLAALMKLCYLAAETGRRRGRESGEFMAALGSVPGKAGALLKSTETAMKVLAAHSYKAVYLFASGFNLGSAPEAALKLQESSQTISIPFELEEGMHGPWVTINPGDLVTVFHFNGRYHHKSLELIRSLRHIGADLLVIGNVPSFDEKVREYIFIDEDELLSPFYTVLPLYQLAYFTALEKGKNPDLMRLWEKPYLETRLSLPR